jgi:dTDP-4-amino-4,6-dideoxygalactose transaminase
MGGNELKYVLEAFESNWIAPLGPNVDEFEKSISKFCGVHSSVALSSGTAAIHLALILMGVTSGDEVVASSFTFSATINPIIYQGALPVLVDSEQKTWNMSPDLLKEAIEDRISRGKKPKALILVHLYGMPADMDEIMHVASSYEIPVIEDAAEALGSSYKGRQVGSFGVLGVLSFNGNKIITTSGGGALLSDHPEYIARARFLATQARDQAPHYQHSEIGFNYRMSNVLAGIGRGQMEVINQRIAQRRFNYLAYKKALGHIQGLSFLEEPDSDFFSNRWLTTMIIDPEKSGTTREKIMSAMQQEDIECRPLWKPMHLQPVFSGCPAYLSGISEKLFQQGLCLPSGTGLSEVDRGRVVSIVKRCISS